MTFGFCCSQPACRPRPASLPVRVPTVESLLSASFSFPSRLRLAVRYGYRHRFRLAPFIQLDSAHAGHTGAGTLACLHGPCGPPILMKTRARVAAVRLIVSRDGEVVAAVGLLRPFACLIRSVRTYR